jgi:protein CWC15
MTTAHRPTWKAAVGRADEGGWSAGGAVSNQKSGLDAPAHTSLKFRPKRTLLDKEETIKNSLLALEEADTSAVAKLILKTRRPVDPAVEKRAQQRLLKQTTEVDDVALKEKYNDSDSDDGGGGKDDSGESDLDAGDDSDLDGSDSSDDDDDDEEDEKSLQAELAKIRAERESAKQKAQEEAEAQENEKQEESAILGNPLLNETSTMSGRMKRRWNDDVVFRNQAKGEPKGKKRFINDTVRNDFHKRFLNKFMR